MSGSPVVAMAATSSNHARPGRSPGQCGSPGYAVAAASARSDSRSSADSHAATWSRPFHHAHADSIIGSDARMDTIGFSRMPPHASMTPRSLPEYGPRWSKADIIASFTGTLSHSSGARPPVTAARAAVSAAVIPSVTTVRPVHITATSGWRPSVSSARYGEVSVPV